MSKVGSQSYLRFGLVIFWVILLSVACGQNADAAAGNDAGKPPLIAAETACLLRVGTSQVLYGKDEERIMYPASTTKIVTCLTALEQGKLDDIVTISRAAAETEGSSLDLQAGEQLTLRELLKGMMLVSGNDAAQAVAEKISGSTAAFAEVMNAEAQKAGAVKSNFSNPHGLPDPINHFTTAHDMALITQAAFARPEFVQIVSAANANVQFLRPVQSRHVENTNRLLRTYAGANGVKTGFTNAAGLCLVAAAKRNNVQLLVVIFNSDNRWDDAAKLLDYGFRLTAGR